MYGTCLVLVSMLWADSEILNRMKGSVVGGDGAAARVKQWVHDRSRIFHHYLNKIRPYPTYRWIGTLAIAAIYVLRVYYTRGFVWVSYVLSFHLVALLVLFLSPLHVPKKLEVLDGPLLPIKGSDEFKHFIRFLPAFKLW